MHISSGGIAYEINEFAISVKAVNFNVDGEFWWVDVDGEC